MTRAHCAYCGRAFTSLHMTIYTPARCPNCGHPTFKTLNPLHVPAPHEFGLTLYSCVRVFVNGVELAEVAAGS